MCRLYLCKKSIPKKTLVVSDGKSLVTISKRHSAEFAFYTPNDKHTVSVVFTILPSAKVTIKV